VGLRAGLAVSDEPAVPLAQCWALVARQPAIAERFARQRLAQAPDDGEAHKLLAAALTRQGRMDEAIAAAQVAVAALPQDAAAQFGLANALSGSGRIDDALAAPDAFTRDTAKATQLSAQRAELERALARVEEEWLALSEVTEAV